MRTIICRLVLGVTLTFFCLLSVTEVGGRVLLWKKYGGAAWRSVALFEDDPEVGYRHRPNSYSFTVRINSLGFRGKEIAAAKLPNVFRIVAIGSSTTFGSSNREDDTYPVRLETRLNSHDPPARYEVINAGVSGYYSYQQVLRVKRELRGLQPGMVILFEGWNDFWHAARLGEKWRPNIIDQDMGRSFTSFFYNSSVSYRTMLLLQRKLLRALKDAPDSRVTAWYQAAAENHAVYDNYQNNMEEIVRLFLERDIKVLLIKFPCLLRKSIDRQEQSAVKLIEPFWEEYLPFVKAHERLLQRIDTVAQKYSIQTVDIEQAFNELQGPDRAQLFTDAIHFTAKGNDLIAQKICEQIVGILEYCTLGQSLSHPG